jgi:RIO kinase 1
VPNDPYLDASVSWRIRSGGISFQEPTYHEAVQAILDADLATEIVGRIGSGKEADVYLGLDQGERVAIKVYRLFRSSHRGGRPIKSESMGRLAAEEFDRLYQALRGGAPVPAPIRRFEHMVSMEFIDRLGAPAPRLQTVRLERPAQALALFLEGVERLTVAGIVHTDLSAFNILVDGSERLWFIDLAKALRVDRLGASPWMRLTEAMVAFRHGLGTVASHFRRYGLALDAETLVRETTERVDRFGVMK